ncbi:hypothetical protein IWQ62_006006 [Dispira parvispora]|uniref:Uncharacterized protein n=1 Tax=Dispira parvispora TaxID=1520584 RepID=A0A9W8APC9_9FUNG|nr:hypothetical protein IWQ62_006006 [Dispira parvispora]
MSDTTTAPHKLLVRPESAPCGAMGTLSTEHQPRPVAPRSGLVSRTFSLIETSTVTPCIVAPRPHKPFALTMGLTHHHSVVSGTDSMVTSTSEAGDRNSWHTTSSWSDESDEDAACVELLEILTGQSSSVSHPGSSPMETPSLGDLSWQSSGISSASTSPSSCDECYHTDHPSYFSNNGASFYVPSPCPSPIHRTHNPAPRDIEPSHLFYSSSLVAPSLAHPLTNSAEPSSALAHLRSRPRSLSLATVGLVSQSPLTMAC